MTENREPYIIKNDNEPDEIRCPYCANWIENDGGLSERESQAQRLEKAIAKIEELTKLYCRPIITNAGIDEKD
jgi:hypothetical protein